MSAEQAKENMDLLLMMMQQTMKTIGVAIGWNEKDKKLVLLDVKTRLTANVDLEELNKSVFSE